MIWIGEKERRIRKRKSMLHSYMSCDTRKPVFGVSDNPTRSDTIRHVQPQMAAPVAERFRALFLNHSIISPLCLVWVRAPLWPHVRQAKFCLRVCQVVFFGVLPFSPHLLIGIQIYEEEGLYYPSSENKGADQLHSYFKADLLFLHRQKSGFLMTRLIL